MSSLTSESGRRGLMKLHIGGFEAKEGWKILNAQPGPAVDYVGNCVDLSQFPDASIEEIYASHVLEHLGYVFALPAAVAEVRRVLTKGGVLKLSVPDLDVLCRLFLEPDTGIENRITVMRMMFGGQMDEFDFHYVGFSYDILAEFLTGAGFSRIERVRDFGLFKDSSVMEFRGTPISLNVLAYR